MLDGKIQYRVMHKAATPLEYQVYRAGLEWDLLDPIVIEKRDDLKSESKWRDRVEPYNHQVTNLITFCRRLPVTLLADDVGLGKTISAGLIVSELIARSRLTHFLVVCPKLLAPQWKEELATKFEIESTIATGKDLVRKEPAELGAIITTYNSARLYLDDIPRDRFQMLILDEAHKLRNLYGVESPPQVAQRFRSALEERRFRYVLMLTATPIQNRLWDLYSLVDLLTVARGHQNPFGSEGMFARKFIADHREKARQLRPEAREEFQSIVYGYMSRIRRGDANLYFPDRKVQLHRVDPTPNEVELIKVIAKGIQQLNRLAQISVLQALTSSPEALRAQLENMARNGTVPAELSHMVNAIVRQMPLTAKLQGLGSLIQRLKSQDSDKWRMVVFTSRRETQTTIQSFLEQHGLKVGIINGSSGPRNSQTLAAFRKMPPDCHVIVSTEAGSEGINLQVANVLINYDLPWNPMIVEQRIGRVQRLKSPHASVGIFNIILRGTFEEFIVGRLMEKLQLASHAIGDIDALLEASGIGGGDEESSAGFDEQIRRLVVAALTGMDVDAATQKAIDSIDEAKATLEREEANINSLLGGMDGRAYTGPRGPRLPSHTRSMEPREFTISAFKTLGARVTELPSGFVCVEENGNRHHIRFEEQSNRDVRSELYAPGSGPFLTLVHRVVGSGVHHVEDLDSQPSTQSHDIASNWVRSFDATLTGREFQAVSRCFTGEATILVRATVAHDSYERLVTVKCGASEHTKTVGPSGLDPLLRVVPDAREIGIDEQTVLQAGHNDPGIAEFHRFYLERCVEEVKAAGDSPRKAKRLEDEFTPKLETTLVALDGSMYRRVQMRVRFRLEGDKEYQSILTVLPHDPTLIDAPKLLVCAKSGRKAPAVCLKQCEGSRQYVLEHLLSQSDASGRYALPEFTVICAVSKQRLLRDEVELSAVTNNPVAKWLLKASEQSGMRAEPEHFDKCEFTHAEILKSEVAISEGSGKRYRSDQRERSVYSGKTGHRSEFVICDVTGNLLMATEAETCAETGALVSPGILQKCSLSGKRVLPSELEISAVSGQPVLRSMLRSSQISRKRAEPEHFGQCEFTGTDALKAELAISEISGKSYRADEGSYSSVSGKNGHRSEFIWCFETRKSLIPSEAERCEVTGRYVCPGILETCAESGKRVLPSELERCASSGKKALKRFIVTSSISHDRVLETLAVQSSAQKYCTPAEAQVCSWSGRKVHPDDMRTCTLTRLGIHFQFVGTHGAPRLQPLMALLDGTRQPTDAAESWESIARHVNTVVGGGRCEVEAAAFSPDRVHLAVCCISTQYYVMKYRVGLVYRLSDQSIEGRLTVGKRSAQGWTTV